MLLHQKDFYLYLDVIQQLKNSKSIPKHLSFLKIELSEVLNLRIFVDVFFEVFGLALHMLVKCSINITTAPVLTFSSSFCYSYVHLCGVCVPRHTCGDQRITL